jgi:hypothetical protein
LFIGIVRFKKPDHTRWIAHYDSVCRDIFRNHGLASHDATSPKRDAWQDDGIEPNPTVVLDCDGSRLEW